MDYRRFRNLNESCTAKKVNEGMSFAEAAEQLNKSGTPNAVLTEYYDEEAPLGRNTAYSGYSVTRGQQYDPVPKWWLDAGHTASEWRSRTKSSYRHDDETGRDRGYRNSSYTNEGLDFEEVEAVEERAEKPIKDAAIGATKHKAGTSAVNVVESRIADATYFFDLDAYNSDKDKMYTDKDNLSNYDVEGGYPYQFRGTYKKVVKKLNSIVAKGYDILMLFVENDATGEEVLGVDNRFILYNNLVPANTPFLADLAIKKGANAAVQEGLRRKKLKESTLYDTARSYLTDKDKVGESEHFILYDVQGDGYTLLDKESGRIYFICEAVSISSKHPQGLKSDIVVAFEEGEGDDGIVGVAGWWFGAFDATDPNETLAAAEDMINRNTAKVAGFGGLQESRKVLRKNKLKESKSNKGNVFEIVYSNHTSQIVDGPTAAEIIDGLEAFDRDDVLHVKLVKKNGDFDTIWTEEEGLFVSQGKLDQLIYESKSNVVVKEDLKKKLKEAVTNEITNYVISTNAEETEDGMPLDHLWLLGWDSDEDWYADIDSQDIITADGDIKTNDRGMIEISNTETVYAESTPDDLISTCELARKEGYDCCVCKLEKDTDGNIVVYRI